MCAAARRRRGRRLRRVIVGGTVVLLGIVLVALVAGVVYEATLPGVGDAPARVRAIVLSHRGTLGPEPAPPRLAAAAVSVEDEHFYSNIIVNVASGAGRAALAALHGGGDPGGSTIPQQLAKELYDGGAGLGATLRALGLGIKLSARYSRGEVLAMYLDASYFGNGYWGDAAAARGYFGVSPRRLDWSQAAMLAGLLQAPSAYDPLAHYRLAKERQRHVLDQLAANGYITARQADAAYRAPLGLLREPAAAGARPRRAHC